MKILLLKPISAVYYVIQPNLGLAYLAAIMLAGGHQVRILDAGKERLTWHSFRRIIRLGRYDLIGIQMFTYELNSVKRHIDIIKRLSPETQVIVGGSHISADPYGTMAFLKGADFGFSGEAETGMDEFLRLRSRGSAAAALLRKIPGLVWRENGKLRINPNKTVQDLDRIRFPAWELVPPASYPLAPHGSFCRRAPVAPLIISRGCPFRCTFCAGRTITGDTIRYRSVENVIEEITLLYRRFSVREVHIEDDNFTLKKDYVLNFCRAVIKSGLNLALALPNGVRLDTLDKEMLQLMERAGFYSAALGIETGSDSILRLMRKRLSKELIREKVALVKRCTRMRLTGFFLIGYPGETEAQILETIAFAKSLRLNKASFMFVMPLPGTELWDIYRRNTGGNIRWENFFYYRVFPGLSCLPLERLKRLQRKAVWEFYSRPGILWGLLKEVRDRGQLKIIVSRVMNIFLRLR